MNLVADRRATNQIFENELTLVFILANIRKANQPGGQIDGW